MISTKIKIKSCSNNGLIAAAVMFPVANPNGLLSKVVLKDDKGR